MFGIGYGDGGWLFRFVDLDGGKGVVIRPLCYTSASKVMDERSLLEDFGGRGGGGSLGTLTCPLYTTQSVNDSIIEYHTFCHPCSSHFSRGLHNA